MEKRKLSGKRNKKLKTGGKRKSFQEFIDGIHKVLNERKEMKELYKRVLILKPEDVLEEMEIRKRNHDLLEAHIRSKAQAFAAKNENDEKTYETDVKNTAN
jgi:hypothetical protein